MIINIEHCGDMSISGSILHANIDKILNNDESWRNENIEVSISNVISDNVDLDKDIRKIGVLINGHLVITFMKDAFKNQRITKSS